MVFRFFSILTVPTKALVELLKSNVIGTPGQSMLYQHLEVEKKLDKIANPFYVTLIKGDNIIGSCCFCHRDTSNTGKQKSSFTCGILRLRRRIDHRIKQPFIKVVQTVN